MSLLDEFLALCRDTFLSNEYRLSASSPDGIDAGLFALFLDALI